MGAKGCCVWNDAKASSNWEKHGVAFLDVADLFEFEPMLIHRDRRRDYGEFRFNGLARLQGLIINITFTPRTDRIHLISARPASSDERTAYRAATSKNAPRL